MIRILMMYCTVLYLCVLSVGASCVLGQLNFSIKTTWNGANVNHAPVNISLSPGSNNGLLVKITAPYFNSPPGPSGPPGQPFPGLWDYEVVEAFFLNDRDQYLEVELCPHGQHLLLILNGQRKMVKDKLALTTFTATITGNKWTGEAILPRAYFPPSVTKFNAYAIHGEGDNRIYESLYPASHTSQPDFHALQFFHAIDMKKVLNNYQPGEVSDLWAPYVTAVG